MYKKTNQNKAKTKLEYIMKYLNMLLVLLIIVAVFLFCMHFFCLFLLPMFLFWFLALLHAHTHTPMAIKAVHFYFLSDVCMCVCMRLCVLFTALLQNSKTKTINHQTTHLQCRQIALHDFRLLINKYCVHITQSLLQIKVPLWFYLCFSIGFLLFSCIVLLSF